jgi:dihydroxy-acid dehydratase
MPEAGYIPIPLKLARQGVKDMVRISDARMSGTAFGTIVLHVTPEAAAGGPLALVESGDTIELDVGRRRRAMRADEPARRRTRLGARAADRATWLPAAFTSSMLQADAGCDFDFMRADAMTDGTIGAVIADRAARMRPSASDEIQHRLE